MVTILTESGEHAVAGAEALGEALWCLAKDAEATGWDARPEVGPLQCLPLRRLALQEERLGEFALATDLERSFAETSSGSQVVDLSALVWPQSRLVITLVLHVLRLLPFLVGGHRQLALENLALRQQLAIYKRTLARPQLRATDRLFWAGLARIWTGWRQALVIVAPDTVLRWQRRRFREYWTHSRVGLPAVARPSTPRSPPWLGRWRPRILSGAPRASTESS